MAVFGDFTFPFKLLNRADGNGPYTFSARPGQREDRIRIAVAWEHVETALEQIQGKRETTGAGSGATTTAQIPIRHPWNSKLYAIAVDGEAVGADREVTVDRPWPTVILTITFGYLGFDPQAGEQPYIQVRRRASSSFVTLPGSAFTFVGNGERLDQDVGRLVGQLAYEITKFQVPDIDQFMDVAEPLMGCVNSDSVRLGKRTIAAGHLLFPTMDSDTGITVGGVRSDQLTFPLVYRTVKWNQAMRSDGTIDTLSPTPYPTAALSALLT